MMSISTTLFGEISHASLFFTGQLRNPWQMFTEPWQSLHWYWQHERAKDCQALFKAKYRQQ